MLFSRSRQRAVLLLLAAPFACGKHPAQGFSADTIAVTVPMGYAQGAPIRVVGGPRDDWVVAKAEAAFDDLVYGFVGAGSTDEPAQLKSRATLLLRLSVTSPDATRTSYQLPIGLYSLSGPDADPATGTRIAGSTVSLTLNAPVVNLTAVKIADEPRNLSQRWRLTNAGDEVEDLTVAGRAVLASQIVLRPEMDHVDLAAGASIEFEVLPELFPGMTSLAGELEITAAKMVQRAPIAFAPPAGKAVRIGFGASSYSQRNAGSYCTNQGKLKMYTRKGPRDRPPKKEKPEFWSKAGVAAAYSKGTGEGMAAANTLGKVARLPLFYNVPFMALGKVFDGISKKIGKDPVDANYAVVALPSFRTPPATAADPSSGLTQAGADALNAVVANGYLVADVANAAFATADKLAGARAAGDADWTLRQEIVARAYAEILANRTRVQADLLRAFLSAAPPAFAQGFTAADVRAMQTDLAANGFDSSQVAAFNALGLGDADIAEAKAQILAADPDAVATTAWAHRAEQLWSSDDASPMDLGRVFELAATVASASPLTAAAVMVRFEPQLGRCPIGSHTTKISLNGEQVASLDRRVPEGLYQFSVDPAKIEFYGSLPGGNSIEIETRDLNTGDFVRALDTVLFTQHRVHGELVLAASQAEADSIVASLGTMNHGLPDVALFDNGAPSLVRSKIQPTDTVAFPLVAANLGEGSSSSLAVNLYGADPRLGDPGPALASSVGVAAIPAGGQRDVALSIPGQLLVGERMVPQLFIAVSGDASMVDYDPRNNVIVLNSESICQ